jgi:hypothetical protein
MNGIEQIRQSRKDGYWGSSDDDYECLEAERHVDYLLAEVDRLYALVEKASKLQAIEGAARELITTPLPMPLDADADLETMQRAKAALMLTREFQERLEALVTELAAFDAAKDSAT